MNFPVGTGPVVTVGVASALRVLPEPTTEEGIEPFKLPAPAAGFNVGSAGGGEEAVITCSGITRGSCTRNVNPRLANF